MTFGRFEYESAYVRSMAHPPESEKHQWFAFCFIIARNNELCLVLPRSKMMYLNNYIMTMLCIYLCLNLHTKTNKSKTM